MGSKIVLWHKYSLDPNKKANVATRPKEMIYWKGKVVNIVNWERQVIWKAGTKLLLDDISGNSHPILSERMLSLWFSSNSKGMNFLWQALCFLHWLYNVYQIKKTDATTWWKKDFSVIPYLTYTLWRNVWTTTKCYPQIQSLNLQWSSLIWTSPQLQKGIPWSSLCCNPFSKTALVNG